MKIQSGTFQFNRIKIHTVFYVEYINLNDEQHNVTSLYVFLNDAHDTEKYRRFHVSHNHPLAISIGRSLANGESVFAFQGTQYQIVDSIIFMPDRVAKYKSQSDNGIERSSRKSQKKWIHPDKRKSESIRAWQGGACTPK